jgi:hypothetical protein
MLTWAQANVPAQMKQGLDYVLVSYYNDSCSPSQPEPNWQTLFANLSAMFPNAKVGFGEVGWSTRKAPRIQRRTTLINDFRGLRKSLPIRVPVESRPLWRFEPKYRCSPFLVCRAWEILVSAEREFDLT